MNFSWDEENETGFVTKGKEIDLIINLFLQRKTLYCCGQWGDALFASFASLAETTEPEVIHWDRQEVKIAFYEENNFDAAVKKYDATAFCPY